jgi:hypothetical protein
MSNQPTGNDEEHFEDRYWIDLVRGLNPGNCGVEMQQHLDGGCKVCRRDRDSWSHLFYFGRDEGLYEPPEEIIQQVKGLFNKRGYGNVAYVPRGEPSSSTAGPG